jgi:plasmid stability protein
MEAEARAILTAVCLQGETRRPVAALQEWVDELYAARRPRRVVDALIAERRRAGAKE